MPATKPKDSVSLPFRPKARLLVLLGDQLIRSAGIAIFELVKNAYDADAETVRITMEDPEDMAQGRIEVEDDGSGMTLDTVTNVWLEPGSGHREDQRLKGIRSPKYGRLPMGEKGVGRFAAHKLGGKVQLVTRAAGQREVVVEVDWDAMIKSGKYLDEVTNTVWSRKPEVFVGKATGTRITITGLRERWSRGSVRELARTVRSIQSPFKEVGSFQIELNLPGKQEWLHGLIDVGDIRKYALYEVRGIISGDQFQYEYKFRPFAALGIPGRKVKRSVKIARPRVGRKSQPDPLDLDCHNIGPVQVDMLIYDLDQGVLMAGVVDRNGLREYLKHNGGIRVYRDNVRVFDYAEPGNDWLDLEGRRINRPGLKLSNNLVLGAVSLRREDSTDLIEKTNREGFVENETYHDLVHAVQAAIVHVEEERRQDKDRLRRDQTKQGAPRAEPIVEDVEKIRRIAEKKGFLDDIGPLLSRIERDYRDVRDTLLTSANAGLSLTVVLHEVEKGLGELRRAVEQDNTVSDRIRRLAERLGKMVDGLAATARRSGREREKASELIDEAVFNNELRLEYHKVRVQVDVNLADFTTKCSRHLTIATLMNIIDNSIWWLDHHPPATKQLRIFTSRDLAQGPAIIIADNNKFGFIDPPEVVIRPFHTRRPGGMGLGLHVADEVMRAQGGHFAIVGAADVGLPRQFKAVVALIFPGAQWLA